MKTDEETRVEFKDCSPLHHFFHATSHPEKKTFSLLETKDCVEITSQSEWLLKNASCLLFELIYKGL